MSAEATGWLILAVLVVGLTVGWLATKVPYLGFVMLGLGALAVVAVPAGLIAGLLP